MLTIHNGGSDRDEVLWSSNNEYQDGSGNLLMYEPGTFGNQVTIEFNAYTSDGYGSENIFSATLLFGIIAESLFMFCLIYHASCSYFVFSTSNFTEIFLFFTR